MIKSIAHTIVDSAGAPTVNMEMAIKQNVKSGCFAGEVLLSVLALKQAGLEYSVLRGRHLARKLTQNPGIYDAENVSPSWSVKAWSKFKRVAHCWAAHLYYERLTQDTTKDEPDEENTASSKEEPEYESAISGTPTKGKSSNSKKETVRKIDFVEKHPSWSFDDDKIFEFLSIAKSLYEEGINIKPARAKQPVLDAKNSWTVPDGEPLPELSISIKPPKNLNRLMADYSDI